MYVFKGCCGERIEGKKTDDGRIDYACNKRCVGIVTNAKDVKCLQEQLCDDCSKKTKN